MYTYDIVLIGGGPANLMAASFLVQKGLKIALFEQNSQVGKKFLVAGKSGLNLSMDYPYNQFVEGYYRDQAFIHSVLKSFTPVDQRQFFKEVLGINTFVGSAGKVFPEEHAVHVLKTWLQYLKKHQVEVFTHHKWISSSEHIHRILDIKSNTTIEVSSRFTIFGLGGNSWRETGSNANWVSEFSDQGIQINPFQSSNSGLICKLDPFIFEKWDGHFIKNCKVTYGNKAFTGEIRIGKGQLEGSPIYHINHWIRQDLEQKEVTLYLDFKPQWSQEQVEKKWRSKQSISKNCKALKLSPVFPSLFRSLNISDSPIEYVKQFPIHVLGFEELDKAISTIGGVDQKEINSSLGVKKVSHWFVNGEMIDWDAPTGGYLLSACFAMGKQIGEQIVQQIESGKLS